MSIKYDSFTVQNWVWSNMEFYSTVVLSPLDIFLFLIQILVWINFLNKLNLSMSWEYKMQYWSSYFKLQSSLLAPWSMSRDRKSLACHRPPDYPWTRPCVSFLVTESVQAAQRGRSRGLKNGDSQWEWRKPDEREETRWQVTDRQCVHVLKV